MSTMTRRERETSPSNKFSSNIDSATYDAPLPQAKQLNIPVPPLPLKNHTSSTPSPSSSTASTITQDDNIDAMVLIEKPMNKILHGKSDESTD